MDVTWLMKSTLTVFRRFFDKQLTLRQLNAFLKSPEELVFNWDIPQSSCLCEIYENILLISKGITSSAKIALANIVNPGFFV